MLVATLTALSVLAAASPAHLGQQTAMNNVTLAVVEASVNDRGVWAAINHSTSWASLVVVPSGVLHVCDEVRQATASRASGVPIVVACGGHTQRVVATDAAGQVVPLHSNTTATFVVRTHTTTAAAADGNITTTDSTMHANLTVGVATGSGVWDPMLPRELMLRGAELIIDISTPAAPGSFPGTDLEHAMLLTRGFENVAAVLQ